ncbi:hypothetical protein [Sphingobacterium zeae]|uniref:hypothetical protein n=1 Tax=Sphingobacterium zeae TaxID=1776859 RepID=UPI00361482F5
MPFNHSKIDHTPLVHETELIINDLQKLVEQVGLLLLGHHRHIAAVLAAKKRTAPPSTDVMIDRAQKQLCPNTDTEVWKRDGWLFQMMTWISVRMEYSGVTLISQAPHTNMAQHGIDGLAIVLTATKRIEALIIAEDKYTENPRPTLKDQVWPEFKLFEKGEFDSQLVTQISMLLGDVDDEDLETIIKNDIYKKENRVYRAGITPLSTHSTPKKTKRLFNGYDDCVSGANQIRRQALTFRQADIRQWMVNFSSLIFNFLETQRP